MSWPVLVTWTIDVPPSPTTKSESVSLSYVTADASCASRLPAGAVVLEGSGRLYRAMRVYVLKLIEFTTANDRDGAAAKIAAATGSFSFISFSREEKEVVDHDADVTSCRHHRRRSCVNDQDAAFV